MSRAIRSSLVILALAVCGPPVTAQGVDLTDERTPETKWTRALFFSDATFMGTIAYAKSRGQTVEQLGDFWTDWAAPAFWGQPGTETPTSFVRIMFLNYNVYPNFEFEILSETETEISGRMNTPYAGRFGEDGIRAGVTLDEFRQMYWMMYEGIADYEGLDLTHEMNGEWINFTVKTK